MIFDIPLFQGISPNAVTDSVNELIRDINYKFDLSRAVNVKAFGAKGDGVTDDLQAILNASSYLKSIGGGALYFPAGHYRSYAPGYGLFIENFIEYFGDGYASWLDFGWNVFQLQNNFTYAVIGSATNYAASDVVSGTTIVTSTTPANANNFAAGDIIMIRSITYKNIGGGQQEPYFLEINRVVSSNASTGVIVIEDQIADSWTGIVIANVTPFFAQNFSIHDLRVTADITIQGGPFKINGMYKSVIRDCWAEGVAFNVNGMVRSVMHGIRYRATTIASAPFPAALEIQVGSVQSSVYDCEFDIILLTSFVPVLGNLVTIEENSRRITIRDCKFWADGVRLGSVFFFQTAGGHRIENCEVTGLSMEVFIDYIVPTNDLAALQFMPFYAKNIKGRVSSGFHFNIRVSGAGQNMFYDNIRLEGTASDINSTGGVPSCAYITDAMTNCVFDRIHSDGVFSPFVLNVSCLVRNSIFNGWKSGSAQGYNTISQNNRDLATFANLDALAAAPTHGTWNQGDVVWNSGATATGFAGWVCTVAGTPGTWKTFGVISA